MAEAGSREGGEWPPDDVEWPAVSIVVPTYNEEGFIRGLLECIAGQDYPTDRLEAIVVDGRSTDATRRVVRSFSTDVPLSLVDNPDRHTPHALNRGIRSARGEVIVRMDAHAEFPSDYVSRCVHGLMTTRAENVGGVVEVRPRREGLLPWALAAVTGSPWGAGGSRHRRADAGRAWVDTVFGGCYRRELFGRIGPFDERLHRGQDREFNDRLRRAGGKILLDPEIRAVYYARGRLGKHLRWMFESGKVPFRISRVTGRRIWSARNLVPPAALLVGALSAAAPATGAPAWPLAALVALYLLLTAGASALEAGGDFPRLAVLLPVFAATHLAYALGAAYEILTGAAGDREG